MRFMSVGNKADVVYVSVRNVSTYTIPAGAPVFYAMNGTDDGLAVVGANDAGAALQGMFAGFTSRILASGATGEAQVYGIVNNVRVLTGTRATPTDPFTTAAAIALGDILNVATAPGQDAMQRNAAGATATAYGGFYAAQTLAAVASTASTSTYTALTRGVTLKCFVRNL